VPGNPTPGWPNHYETPLVVYGEVCGDLWRLAQRVTMKMEAALWPRVGVLREFDRPWCGSSMRPGSAATVALSTGRTPRSSRPVRANWILGARSAVPYEFV
jgi:hypothetical protein